MSLKDKIKSFPTSPGVYFFKDKKRDIIYIGKAKNIKNRVRSYFSKSNKDNKNKIMVSKAKNIEYLIVNNEVEALITEANMIKEYKPRYNIFLKDDKTFPYIMITNEPYPKVEIIRKKNISKDGNIYFGPYTDVNYLREILKVLHKIFPIRTCSFYIDEKSILDKKYKICLDYHIGKCQGPCEGLVDKKIYKEMIGSIIDFLRGKNSSIKNKIELMMNKASKEMNYEHAAKFRDQLIALDSFYKKQKKIVHDFNDQDVLNVTVKDGVGIGFIMRIRNGLLIGREKFEIKVLDGINDDLFNGFIMQYYNNTFDIPNEVILNTDLKNKNILEEWLSSIKSKKIKIIKPLIGYKKKILDLCIRNSEMILKETLIKKIKRKEYIPKILKELQEVLSMSILPRRIEAFDNSNIQGSNAVAGLVCFINGKPVKKEYRRFNIKSVKGIDDFESMREVVFRRYSRQLKEKQSLPDLILIDGGKGQLSSAKSSLDKLGLGYIAVIGLAKKLEEVYMPSSSEPQNISKTSPALYLLRKIRDEVHRYAIAFHRNKRKKQTLNSFFDNVKGMGKNRIKKIWKVYSSLDDLLKDSIDSIYAKTKIPKSIIKDIKKIK